MAQRLGIDLALVALAVVALWQLRLYGAPLTRNARGVLGVDPLLVAAPAIGLLAGAVLATRLIPRLAEIGERTLSRGRGIVSPLGARQVARRPLRYTRSALLLILAAALGTFAATSAATWARSQVDQAAYRSAGDIRAILSDYPDLPDWASGSAYRSIPGVTAATPVSGLSLDIGRTVRDGRLLAVDPAATARIVRFPPEAAGAPALLDRLAQDRPTTAAVALDGEPRRLALTLDADLEVDPVGLGRHGDPAGLAGARRDRRPPRRRRSPPPDRRRRDRPPGEGRADRAPARRDARRPRRGGGLSAAPRVDRAERHATARARDDRQRRPGRGRDEPVGVRRRLGAGRARPGGGGLDLDPRGRRAHDRLPAAGGITRAGSRSASATRSRERCSARSTAPVRRSASTADPTGDGTLAAIAGDRLLALTGAHVGDTIAVDSAAQALTIRIVGSVASFPPLDPDGAVPRRRRGVARSRRVRGLGFLDRSDRVVAGGRRRAGRGDRDDPRDAAVLGRPRSSGGPSWRPPSPATRSGSGSSARSVSGRSRRSCSRRSGSRSGRPSRRASDSASSPSSGRSGCPAASCRLWLTLEQVFLVAVGLVGGVLLGLLLAWLVLPYATLSASGAAVVPAPVIVVPWATILPVSRRARGRPPGDRGDPRPPGPRAAGQRASCAPGRLDRGLARDVAPPAARRSVGGDRADGPRARHGVRLRGRPAAARAGRRSRPARRGGRRPGLGSRHPARPGAPDRAGRRRPARGGGHGRRRAPGPGPPGGERAVRRPGVHGRHATLADHLRHEDAEPAHAARRAGRDRSDPVRRRAPANR